MTATRRLGIVARHHDEAKRWLAACELDKQFHIEWQLLHFPDDLRQRLDGLVWLWEPTSSDEDAKAEKQRWGEHLRALHVHCDRPLPVILVAPNEVTEEGMPQLKTQAQSLRKSYLQRRQGWVPAELVDKSRITLQVTDASGGQRLLEQFTTLDRSLQRWLDQAQRQADRCLKVGIMLAAAYFTLLFSTMYWKPAKRDKASADPLTWVRADWQYHMSNCQALLKRLGGRAWSLLSPEEQQQFNHHLRWLPVSFDLLNQRKATKETLHLRAGIAPLLSALEAHVTTWTTTPATTLVALTDEQLEIQQMLDGVFEPRPPPTAIHQAAKRFWLQERALALLQLKSATPKTRSSMLSIMQARLAAAESARVHAPELKAAWLQELNSAIQWLEKAIAQPDKKWPAESLPALLKESEVKPE
jgi:hypothetical protein